MRHHTLFHEVDLNIIEQARARKAKNLAVGEGAQKPFVPEGRSRLLGASIHAVPLTPPFPVKNYF